MTLKTTDFHGIGNAVKGAAEVVFITGRQTGRTTLMLRSLQPGDRVICLTENEADHLRRRAKAEGIKCVTFESVPLDALQRIREKKRVEGRTFFDHNWVEHFYKLRLEQTAQDIRAFEAMLSQDEDERKRELDPRWRAYVR